MGQIVLNVQWRKHSFSATIGHFHADSKVFMRLKINVTLAQRQHSQFLLLARSLCEVPKNSVVR